MTINSFLEQLKYTLLRFPLAALACASFTILMCREIEYDSSHLVHGSVAASLVACFFLFVALQLFAESWQVHAKWTSCFGLIVGAALFIYADIYRLSYFIPAFIAFAAVAPFLKRDFDNKAMWLFLCRVGIGFLFSGLISLVLVLGIGLIFLSLEYLFDAKVEPSVARLLLVSAGFIWPLLTMMQIPREFNSHSDSGFGVKLRAIVDYLLSSLWIAYALIINAYALNIAITQSLPRGKVSILVLCLGLSGFVTYFLGDSGESSPALPNRIFRKIFGFLLIAPLILMAVGINYRINEHGLTEARYLNVLLLIAMSVGALCFLLCRKHMIRIFLCALGLLFLCSTIPL